MHCPQNVIIFDSQWKSLDSSGINSMKITNGPYQRLSKHLISLIFDIELFFFFKTFRFLASLVGFTKDTANNVSYCFQHRFLPVKKTATKQVRQKMVSLNNPYPTRTERTKWLGWYRLWNRLNEAEGRWKLSVFRRLSKDPF